MIKNHNFPSLTAWFPPNYIEYKYMNCNIVKMPVNVVKTCRREALCVFYPLIYFFIDSWKAESCHRGMTLDVFFSINNCRKNNMQRYNQSVNILLCLKMHFTLFLLQWVLAEQCVDQVVGTDKIDYFVVKIDVSIRHIQCNLKMRRTHTKKCKLLWIFIMIDRQTTLSIIWQFVI